jgi:uncharacterized membrane protein YczE
MTYFNRLFQEIFAALLGILLLSWGSAMWLASRPAPTPQQQQVLTILTKTWDQGSQTLFDLLSFQILRMFFLYLVQ